MKFIDEVDIRNKKIITRVDYNVSLNSDGSIANDTKILQTLPTLKYLLDKGNKLILISHLRQPECVDEKCSLRPVVQRLKTLLPNYSIGFTNDFNNLGLDKNNIVVLENIRFYPGEKTNDPDFAKQLASLAEIYVNEAFPSCHRKHASVIGIPQFLPSYGGLLLKKEIAILDKIVQNPQKPFIAILGGSKIKTKINLINKLMEIADHVLLGGGLANNFFLAQGKEIGKSIVQIDALDQTRHLVQVAQEKQTVISLPTDVIIQTHETKSVNSIGQDDTILDVGPQTLAHYASLIGTAKTITWNGPVGKFEDSAFRQGTDFIYYAITENPEAVSVIGGGDTITAIDNREGQDKISHISTGGGAMLTYVENGTLPGIEALNNAST